jgi:hypothetical protein
MRYSGASVHSFSYGWFDVTRTRIRYIVVQPENKASEGFDLPTAYVADPRIDKLSGWITVVQFYGGTAGGQKKKNVFNYLPQDRWGTVHTTTGWDAAGKRGLLGMASMVMAMRNFDDMLATVLTAPIRDGDLAKVQALVKDNPDLALYRDNAGMTPLHIAAAQGHEDVVALLLANQADVNAKDNAGETPLDLALGTGHLEVMEMLRQHGGHE